MAESIKLDGTELDFAREMVEQAYDRWAPVYDLVFGGVFSKGRAMAIQATNRLGGRVLEVGVVGGDLRQPLEGDELHPAGQPLGGCPQQGGVVGVPAQASGYAQDPHG